MRSLRETLEKKDIIITLPSNIEWSDYEKELNSVWNLYVSEVKKL